MNKGDYGYMNNYKKWHMIWLILFAVLIVGLVIAAQFVSKALVAICYVPAVVLALPMAKHIVAVFVVFSYHTLDEQSIEDLDEHTRDRDSGLSVYDVTLAGEKSILYTPYLYLTDTELYCLVVDITANVSLDSVRGYLTKILADAGFSTRITMVANISEMNKILEELETAPKANMDMLKNMKEQILIYNV